MKNKMGISPVIATVLLIAMVMIIALIIFLWFRGMIGEQVTKFGKNIKLVCDDVSFEASYENGLYISNTGNVPIFGMKIKKVGEGSHLTENLETGWPDTGLRQGGVFSGDIDVEGVNKIILIPVLTGSSEKEEKTFVCEERHGNEIFL